MRKTVGHHIGKEGGPVSLAPSAIGCDAVEFEDAIRAGDLVRACHLYGGPFLVGAEGVGSAAFEEWVDVTRSGLVSQLVAVVAQLVDGYRGTTPEDALVICQRAMTVHPDDGRLHELNLKALWRAGRPHEAFMVALEVEREVDAVPPSAETIAILKKLRAWRQSAAGLPPFVGRRAELATLVGQDSDLGDGGHFHLSGPAGAGKTRLVSEALGVLSASGSRVVQVSLHRGDRSVTAAAAAELVRALCGLPGARGVNPAYARDLVAITPTAAQLFPTAPSPEGHVEFDLLRSINALSELVDAVVHAGPVAVAIDDLHWADDSSAAVIAGAIARSRGKAARWITTDRTGSLGADFGDAVPVPLGPLSAADIAALIGVRARLDPAAAWTVWLPARLQGVLRGSPLRIREWLRRVEAEGTLAVTDGRWFCEDQARLERALVPGRACFDVASLPDPARRALLLMALAGGPVPFEVVQGALRSDSESLRRDLGELERRGLLQQVVDGWTCDHDELAAVVVADSVESDRIALKLALAQSLQHDMTDRPRHGQRAARLLLELGARRELVDLAADWVRMERHRGSHRPIHGLVAGLMSEPRHSREVTDLTRRLPLRLRYPIKRRYVLAAGIAVFAAGLSVAVAATRRPPADTHTVAFFPGSADDREVVNVFSWPRSGGSDTVVTRLTSRRTDLIGEVGAVSAIARSPDGRSFAVQAETGGDNVLGIFLVSEGRASVLTDSVGDDLSPSWAPDGSRVAFVTSRWSTPGRYHYDIATVDIANRRVEQITEGLEMDRMPAWSPDGARLAFHRSDGPVAALCVVPPAARWRPRCRHHPAGTITEVLGWRDSRTVLVRIRDGARRGLGSIDVVDGDERVAWDNIVVTWLSPDGGLLLGYGTLDDRSPGWWVLSSKEAEPARRIPETRPPSVVYPADLAPRRRQPILGIEIQAGSTTLVRGVDLRLDAQTRGFGGYPLEPHLLVWSSSDTSVVSVDSTGVVSAPGPNGSAWVRAVLPGWRADSVKLHVADPRVRTVLSESWGLDWSSRWVTFGDPQPTVVPVVGRGNAFWNNGDGSFGSGAFSRLVVPATIGAGVETSVSLPLTASMGQAISLALTGALDSASLAPWNLTGGGFPSVASQLTRTCEANLPIEGAPEPRMGFGIALFQQQLPAATSQVSGQWFTLRIQLFPDGSCGLAIDGKAIAKTWERIPMDRPVSIRLGYSSVGTLALIGPLTAWSGVRADVDWSKVGVTRPGNTGWSEAGGASRGVAR